MKTELYHATRSGAVESLLRGIDSSFSQGFGQGPGFFLWKTKQRALEHARGLDRPGEIYKEVSVTGQPVIVVVNVDVTPENFDVDYEEHGPAFLRFLDRNKDWITQHSKEITATIPVAGGGEVINIGGKGMPRRSMRFDSKVLMASHAQSLGSLAGRISAFEPEVIRRFEMEALKQAEAVKYVGSGLLYPSRVETLDGIAYTPAESETELQRLKVKIDESRRNCRMRINELAALRIIREELPQILLSEGAHDCPWDGSKRQHRSIAIP